MAEDIAGTLRKLQLDGTPFNLPADIDVAEAVGQETEGQAHTGGTMYIVKLKVAMREGFVISCNDDDWEVVQALAARAKNAEPPFPCSYTNAAGSSYTADCHLNIEQRQTAENKATIALIPDGDWSPFVA
jgi:hypothetical protein